MATRIVNLTEVSSLQDGDFVVIDNSSNGTHKFKAVELGAIMGQNIASDYSSASPYAVGQICMHDGDLYQCNTAITSGESWNASHWTQITVGIALYNKVDKVTGKGLSENDFTNALKTKLDGIAAGAEVNVQSDWSQSNTSADDYIKNKPTNATTSTAGFMSAADKTKLDGIAANAEVNVQANWNETNTSSDAYIQNKPVANTTLDTAGAFADAKAVGDAFDSLEATLKAGTEATADYHLGFYLDENGDLCQVDE